MAATIWMDNKRKMNENENRRKSIREQMGRRKHSLNNDTHNYHKLSHNINIDILVQGIT